MDTQGNSDFNSVLIEPHYLPVVEYFCLLSSFQTIILNNDGPFVKQGYRTRTVIQTANGLQTLIVPVKKRSHNAPLKEVTIDHTYRWAEQHRRSIESSYRNAPFFEHYADDLFAVLESKHDHLVDLNTALLTICLKWLGWNKNVVVGSGDQFQAKELVNAIQAKKSHKERSFINPKPYYQVFGNGFAENLSLIDLIFCAGPGSAQIVKESCFKGTE
ncbi:MAG: WbqC family protein [Bacteroidetes bacterium]|nr:WbqC family protein [Bacteroidota bacterium]